MNDKMILLGSAYVYLPVIFDICYETSGVREFLIYKNMQVQSTLELPVKKPNYTIRFFEPGESFERDKSRILFGVNGPFAKRNVYDYFNQKMDINRSDYTSIIHPKAILAPSMIHQEGALIEAGTVISSQTVLGFGITMKRRASIGHHCEIGDYVEINPGVTVSGHVKIEPGVIIGSGSVIRNRITIGKDSIIGMGSVVTKDIPPGVVAYGNPCRIIRKNPPRDS